MKLCSSGIFRAMEEGQVWIVTIPTAVALLKVVQYVLS